MPAFIPAPILPLRGRHARRATCHMSFRDNVDALPAASGNELHLFAFRNLSIRAPSQDLVLRNKPGKTASYRIFHAAAAKHDGMIDADVVGEMLDTYAEIVEEARAKPGSHRMVDFLIGLKVGGDNWRFVCKVDGEYF